MWTTLTDSLLVIINYIFYIGTFYSNSDFFITVIQSSGGLSNRALPFAKDFAAAWLLHQDWHTDIAVRVQLRE